MKKCSVGGQAVIEGVMMKNEEKIAVAVRKSDGDIVIDKNTTTSWVRKKGIHKIPFLRGAFVLFETMVEGIKSLNFSAEFFEEDEEEAKESKFENFLNSIFKEKTNDVLIYFSLGIALIFSVLLFMLLPTFLGGLLKHITKNVVALNLFEGLIRIGIFLLYVYLISLNKDIKRVFEYHGAEHKTIYCYESGMELTPENAQKFTTLHPRCGTNFMFIVMIIAMLVFSMFGWPNPVLRVVHRLLCLPIVAGIAYEIIKLAGKCDNKLVDIIIFPGMMLQKLTTREPDYKQLEVAITALKSVIDEEVNEVDYKSDNTKVN